MAHYRDIEGLKESIRNLERYIHIEHQKMEELKRKMNDNITLLQNRQQLLSFINYGIDYIPFKFTKCCDLIQNFCRQFLYDNTSYYQIYEVSEHQVLIVNPDLGAFLIAVDESNRNYIHVSDCFPFVLYSLNENGKFEERDEIEDDE